MIDPNFLETWLKSTNARYRADDLPPRHRPFRALSDFSRDFRCSISLDSPLAKSIFNWFYEHSQTGAHAVGSLFTGAFYYDACFWPLYIPIGYGTFSLNPLDCLKTMPQSIKEHISEDPEDVWGLARYWADCCDYAYGFEDIINQDKLNSRALAFIQSGDQELAGAIAQLLSSSPNVKAILASRMACEIFLKTLLIQEQNLADKQLRKLSHRIEDIAAECFAISHVSEFDAVAKSANAFPDISDRYNGVERKLSDVWNALCVTQVAAAAVIRYYSDRDMRPSLSLHRKLSD